MIWSNDVIPVHLGLTYTVLARNKLVLSEQWRLKLVSFRRPVSSGAHTVFNVLTSLARGCLELLHTSIDSPQQQQYIICTTSSQINPAFYFNTKRVLHYVCDLTILQRTSCLVHL